MSSNSFEHARTIHVPRVPDEPPFILVRVVSECAHCDVVISGHAAGLSEDDAIARAAGEHVELLSLHQLSRHMGQPRLDTAAKLGDRGISLATMEGLPRAGTAGRTDPRASRPWWPVTSATDGREVLVPIESALLRGPEDRRLWVREPLSTGTASHDDVERASQAALLELLERDAFMLAATGRTRPRRHKPPPGIAYQLQQLHERYRLEVETFELATRAGARTVMVVMVDRTGHGPAVTCGLACGWNPEALAVKATLEAWQPRLWLRTAITAGASPPNARECIAGALGRGVFWSTPERLGEVRDLLSLPLEPSTVDCAPQTASELIEQLGASGVEVFEVRMPQPAGRRVVRRFVSPQLLPLILDEALAYGAQDPHPMPEAHFFL